MFLYFSFIAASTAQESKTTQTMQAQKYQLPHVCLNQLHLFSLIGIMLNYNLSYVSGYNEGLKSNSARYQQLECLHTTMRVSNK